MISSVGNTAFPIPSANAPAGRPAEGAVVHLAQATAQVSVDGRLSLTTREGDTVTLAAHADASVTYGSLRGRSADGRFAARWASLEASTEYSLQVQGDLNEQELAEIRKLVKEFLHEMRDAFRGRGFDGEDVLEAGTGSATIAGFSVAIEATRSVTAVAVVARPRPAPAPVPVLPVAEGEAAPMIETDEGTTEPPAASGFGPVIGRLVSAARRAEVAPDKRDAALDRLFGALDRAFPGRGARELLAALRSGVRRAVASPASPAATVEGVAEAAGLAA